MSPMSWPLALSAPNSSANNAWFCAIASLALSSIFSSNSPSPSSPFAIVKVLAWPISSTSLGKDFIFLLASWTSDFTFFSTILPVVVDLSTPSSSTKVLSLVNSSISSLFGLGV